MRDIPEDETLFRTSPMHPGATPVDLAPWRHAHTFGQERKRPGESRMGFVLALTIGTMVAEIVAGLLSGSMALLSDGLHMASHAAALGIGVFAYVYARRHAGDPGYAFGTGKVDSLAGFASALLLAAFAALMAWESLLRLFRPAPIDFDQALPVAFLGLVVNGLSLAFLKHPHACSGKGHGAGCTHFHGPDHNLRAAYLHVMADALTSVLAIFALLCGKHVGILWVDPLMGLLGAGLIAHWAWGLLATTGHTLLDRQSPQSLQSSIRAAIESGGEAWVVDLHIWSIGSGIHSAILSVVALDPRPPGHYKALLPTGAGLAHVSLEVHALADSSPAGSHSAYQTLSG